MDNGARQPLHPSDTNDVVSLVQCYVQSLELQALGWSAFAIEQVEAEIARLVVVITDFRDGQPLRRDRFAVEAPIDRNRAELFTKTNNSDKCLGHHEVGCRRLTTWV